MKVLVVLLILCGLVMAFAAYAQERVPPPRAPEEAGYRLGPEDVLQIQIWGRADLTGPVTLDSAGKIRLPLVGEVEAKGRTETELSKYLTERYRLVDATISEVIVTVSEYNNQAVTVVGEVRNPGRHGFKAIPDLWSVILAAGGATPNADLARVQIVRKEQVPGEPRIVAADLSMGIEHTSAEKLPRVHAQDTITIPSVVEGSISGDKFQVLGAVRTPGVYRLSVARNIVEAISVSGGVLPDADLRKVRLTRSTEAGTVSYELDLEKYLDSGRPVAVFDLNPGDTVTIPVGGSIAGAVLTGITRFSPLLSVAVSILVLVRR